MPKNTSKLFKNSNKSLLCAIINLMYKLEQPLKKFKSLPPKEAQSILDRNNPTSLFHNIIGQNGAIETLADILYPALQHPLRLTTHSALLFYGGRSNGKTMFAKTTAKILQRPLIVCDANLIKKTDDILELIIGIADENKIPIIDLCKKNGKSFCKVPNIIIFIDEIHSLSSKVVHGLLTALEAKDKTMTTNDVYVDVSNVLFIGATTERGDLFPPLESRFFKIPLLDYTPNELSQIIKVNFSEFSDEDCSEIAKYSGMIAREAIDLGVAVNLNAKRKNCSIKEAIDNVCLQKSINENGLTQQQIWILKALVSTPKGLNYEQLCAIAQCNVEELKRYILPPLLVHTDEYPSKVIWNGQRTTITETGIKYVI